MSDLLMNYFNEADILQLHRYMSGIDKEQRLIFQISYPLKISKTSKIKQLKAQVKDWNCTDSIKQMMYKFIEDELSKRGFKGLINKVLAKGVG